jgi:hypothetical protein
LGLRCGVDGETFILLEDQLVFFTERVDHEVQGSLMGFPCHVGKACGVPFDFFGGFGIEVLESFERFLLFCFHFVFGGLQLPHLLK